MLRLSHRLPAQVRPVHIIMGKSVTIRSYGMMVRPAYLSNFFNLPIESILPNRSNLYAPNGVMNQKLLSTKSKDESKRAVSLDELVRSIDTTLTPAQQEYVAKLKRKMKGGNMKRCK
jgi:hypothetical protein